VRLLRIYLDDHAALLLAGGEAVARMRGSASHRERVGMLDGLGAELADDRAAIVARLRDLGASPSRAKSGVAWLGEKAGRLKLNGGFVRPTPLTALVELEALGVMLEWNRALWRALERAGSPESAADGRRRAERAEGRMREVEAARLEAAGTALGQPG
jgi:hypothetical protein